MNILVTGRNGQLGSELHHLSASSDDSFLFVDIEDGDITNKNQLQKLVTEHQIEAIINCAAYTAVDKSEEEQELAYAVNAIGVLNLVEICAENNLRLIHISTDYVFNGEGTAPYKPEDPVSPLGVYGATKRAGEVHLLSGTAEAIIIRTSWVFSSFGGNFVKTMLRLGAERDNLNVVNDQRGCPTYARDLASACLQVIKADWKGKQRIYHFSNSGEITWFDFATEIMRLGKRNCLVNPIPTSEYPTPAKRPAYSVLDTSDLTKDFGITPRNWKEALKDCIAEI